MMTSARTAYFFAPNDWTPLFQRPRIRPWPSRLAALAGGAVRLFHLMAPARPISAEAPLIADASRQEMTQRFQEIMVPHLDAAYNFARFLSRDADASQDIVQDAFLRAYRNFESYRGGDPRAGLFAIVRNCCHVWRQQDRRKARFELHLSADIGGEADENADLEFASEDDSPETATIRRSEQQLVRAVIAGLPETMREILVLRELEDLSYRQIAEIIDAPIGTVMSRLARARREFGIAWDACNRSEAAR